MTLGPADVVLLLGLAIAAVTDMRSGKIPNALTFPMMALGIAIHATLGDPVLGLIGCFAAFLLHFPLYALGVERAGDAKLVMGLGACVGWREMIEATAWLAVLYLPIGLLILAAQGRLGNLVTVARYQLARARGLPAGDPPEPTWFRTGPVIAVGGTIAWATDLLSRLTST